MNKNRFVQTCDIDQMSDVNEQVTGKCALMILLSFSGSELLGFQSTVHFVSKAHEEKKGCIYGEKTLRCAKAQHSVKLDATEPVTKVTKQKKAVNKASTPIFKDGTSGDRKAIRLDIKWFWMHCEQVSDSHDSAY